MKRLAVLALVLLAVPVPVAAQEGPRVTVSELLARAAEITGRVVVEGELIGDYGLRGNGYMWTQLNGDSYAYEPLLEGGALTGGNVGVAVRIPEEFVDKLGGPGGYRVRGPLVRVTGQWEYHDPDRNGESYIDVLSIDVLNPGGPLSEQPNYWVLVAGLVLVVGSVFLRRGTGWWRRG